MTAIQKAREALPCPFCGGKPRIDLAKKSSCQLHGELSQAVSIYCYHDCPAQPRITAGDVFNGGEEKARAEAIEVWNRRPLAALDAETEVKVKPLVWYAPDPEDIQDHDDCVWMARGVGGRYSISTRQLVRITSPDNMGYLLWDADDAFSFTEHLTIEAAKAAAQADYERRIRSALVPPESRS